MQVQVMETPRPSQGNAKSKSRERQVQVKGTPSPNGGFCCLLDRKCQTPSKQHDTKSQLGLSSSRQVEGRMKVAFAATPARKIPQAAFFLAPLSRASSLHVADEEMVFGRFLFVVDVRLLGLLRMASSQAASSPSPTRSYWLPCHLTTSGFLAPCEPSQ